MGESLRRRGGTPGDIHVPSRTPEISTTRIWTDPLHIWLSDKTNNQRMDNRHLNHRSRRRIADECIQWCRASLLIIGEFGSVTPRRSKSRRSSRDSMPAAAFGCVDILF